MLTAAYWRGRAPGSRSSTNERIQLVIDPSDVSNLFAIALIVGIAVIAVSLVWPRLREIVTTAAPAGAAAVAIGATLGSLYFSEVADYVPCTLCWYQRIAMYPMALILPLALIRRDRSIMVYATAMAAAGLLVSVYHVQLQLFPDQDSGACEIVNPCTAKWVEAFGVITIPQMAGLSFVMIIALGVMTMWADRPARSPQ